MRVVPNTARFGSDLKRELRGMDEEVKVPVDFDVDETKLAGHLKAMRIPTIKVPVDFDVAKTLKTQLTAAAKGSGFKVPVEFDIDKAKLNAQLAAIKVKPIKVPVEFDIDQSTLDRLAASRNIEINVDIDTAAAQAQLAALTAQAFTTGLAIRTAGISGTSAFGSLVGVAGGVLATLAKIAPVGFLIAEAGAAITGAWATASTAIAAVPAAIGLIGAPIAAVMLGMEGIKKAAKTLEPEFKKLKESISATFEKGLTPILRSLRDDLTAMTVPLQAVAQSLVNIADKTSVWIQQQGGLQQIQTMFLNIATALNNINLVPLLDGFTKLAGNKAALDALVLTINQVGLSLQNIANNASIDEAFRGLGEVIASLTRAFEGLVNNGIKLFAAAWPGVKAGIDGITQFFSQFDYARLGKAVGDAFRGIGEALKSIPPATVERITASFEALGRALSDEGFQAGMRGFAEVVPLAVDALTLLVRTVEWAGKALGGLALFVANAKVGFADLTDALGITTGAGERARAEFEAMRNRIYGITPAQQLAERGFTDLSGAVESFADDGSGKIDEFGRKIETGIVGPVTALPGQVQPPLGQLPQSFGVAGQQSSDALISPMRPLPGLVGQIMGQTTAGADQGLSGLAGVIQQNAGPAPQTLANLLNPMGPRAGQAAAQVPPAVGQGLQAMGQTIRQHVGPAPQILGQILDPMAPQAQTAGGRINVGFGSGISPMSQTLQQKLGLLPPIANTGWSNVVGTVQPGLAPAAGEVTAGLDPAQQALATSLTGMAGIVPTAFTLPLQTALTTAFSTISAAIPTAFTLPFQTALTTAFTTVNSQIPTLFTLPFQTALTTAFQTVSAAIPTAFTLPFQTALTTAFATVNAQLPTIFTLPFQTALTTAFTTIFALFPTIFTLPFQTALTTAFTTINALLPTIFTLPFQTALTTAFATIFALFPTIFTLPFQTAITTSLTTIAALIPTLFVPINTAFTTAFAAIVALVQPQLDVPMNEAVKLAMTNMDTAVKDGFQTVTASVTAGITAIMAEMDKLPPYGQVTGDNLINAMAAAILAGKSKLVNAIAQVIAAAIAAATAMLQIGSPSRVAENWGDMTIAGFVNSIRDGKSEVVRSIEETFSAAIKAGQQISGALSASLSFDGKTLQAQVTASATIGPANAPPVNVFIGDEPFRGQIRSEIGSYDSRMRHARSVRGGR